MMTISWSNYLPTHLAHRAWNVIRINGHLGFTAFGGPPVHFKIFNDKFVKRLKLIDEQMYQELFGVCQAFSGPGSTKMLYCINLIHDGPFAAILSFLIWSFPGAAAMYGLSVGVSHINDTLPRPAYALLSGLNAATVGVILLAAVELSQKAITNTLTRLIVFFSAAAGMLYNALWYFPVLLVISGFVNLAFEHRWLHKPIIAFRSMIYRLTQLSHEQTTPHGNEHSEAGHIPDDLDGNRDEERSNPSNLLPMTSQNNQQLDSSGRDDELRTIPRERQLNMSWKTGTAIIIAFLASFIAAMVVRSVIASPPLLYRLFANMYLAGTIIFGGGPVVIPLLREYVVAEGWVSPRDFLIGLALIQAIPGPNFNFAVFLGSLTAMQGGYSSVLGAFIAWLGIFSPGIITVHGTMGIWSALRSRRWVKSILKGINAGAVGLIYIAVYRIWQVGYIDDGFQLGRSLGDDPWWVVVTATSYVGGRWFGVPAPVAIVLGAILGLIRYAVVSV